VLSASEIAGPSLYGKVAKGKEGRDFSIKPGRTRVVEASAGVKASAFEVVTGGKS
jgi:hypothetical protein